MNDKTRWLMLLASVVLQFDGTHPVSHSTLADITDELFVKDQP